MRSLVNYSPWGLKESGTVEQLTYTHTHNLVCTLSPIMLLGIPKWITIIYKIQSQLITPGPSSGRPSLTSSPSLPSSSYSFLPLASKAGYPPVMENLLRNLNLPNPPQPSCSTFNTSRRNDPSFPPKTWASLVARMVKHLPAMRETWVRFLGQEDPLEKEMAIHSSTLAWKIPWTEEPDRLQSMGSQRVRHDWATSLSLFFLLRCFWIPPAPPPYPPPPLPSQGCHLVSGFFLFQFICSFLWG